MKRFCTGLVCLFLCLAGPLGAWQAGNGASAPVASPVTPGALARNVVLMIGDGVGLSTINAASIHGYKHSRGLFIQRLPHIGFSDTSSADNWVSDSAAGMTAIVTGVKTLNGVISQHPERSGRGDGEALKTILEYAEEKGLSTGIITNDEITGATPAACYAHVNDRGKHGQIAAQLLTPRFGDGPDVMVAVGRSDVRDIIPQLKNRDYRYVEFPDQFKQLDPAKSSRVIALFGGNYEPEEIVEKAVQILSKNPKGYFLMVEWNSHQKDARETLDNALRLDRTARTIRKVTNPQDTLLLLTADHSYDLRITGAKIGEDIIPRVSIGGKHTAEEVLVAADGPGAERVRGFLLNTEIFQIMKSAFGW